MLTRVTFTNINLCTKPHHTEYEIQCSARLKSSFLCFSHVYNTSKWRLRLWNSLKRRSMKRFVGNIALDMKMKRPFKKVENLFFHFGKSMERYLNQMHHEFCFLKFLLHSRQHEFKFYATIFHTFRFWRRKKVSIMTLICSRL